MLKVNKMYCQHLEKCELDLRYKKNPCILYVTEIKKVYSISNCLQLTNIKGWFLKSRARLQTLYNNYMIRFIWNFQLWINFKPLFLQYILFTTDWISITLISVTLHSFTHSKLEDTESIFWSRLQSQLGTSMQPGQDRIYVNCVCGSCRLPWFIEELQKVKLHKGHLDKANYLKVRAFVSTYFVMVRAWLLLCTYCVCR